MIALKKQSKFHEGSDISVQLVFNNIVHQFFFLLSFFKHMLLPETHLFRYSTANFQRLVLLFSALLK